jgi:prephenate dehydrogenase
MSTLTIIGVGHIGGSFALAAKKTGLIDYVIGMDASTLNLNKAKSLGIIDEGMSLEQAIPLSDIIVVAIPVNHIAKLLPQILDSASHQTVIDVGSTKHNILESIKNHPNRKNFVACHPMAGTEFSGPESALEDLFINKTCVIVNKEQSGEEHALKIESLLRAMQMRLVYLEGDAHDLHVAYVSHISHISSFALALTVLAKEKDEKSIFDLASGGFSSTVRLAKSNPDMWVPIFEQNRDFVLDVLDEHISTLSKFRSLLIKKDFTTFRSMIEEANQIKRILKI